MALLTLEALAEDARALAERRGDEWHDLADVSLLDTAGSPLYWYHQAQRIRFDAASAGRRIAEVRAWFAGRGRTEWCWVVGSSATPDDLVARLEATGAMPEGEPTSVLVLDHEPPRMPAEVTCRVVATDADRRAYDAIRAEAFGFSSAERQAEEASFDERWAAGTGGGSMAFIAAIGGTDGAVGSIDPVRDGAWLLYGAGTLASMRGLGMFTALVRARWEYAVAHAGSGLVVDAKPTSAPILGTLGFRPVARLTRLIDRI